MMRISKTVFAVGGVVLAAGLITFTNPKTVHAVAAALVQVTNTSSNPVVTQSTSQQATQLIQFTCNIVALGGFGLGGTGSGECGTVPSNQSLVITAVDISLRNDHGTCVTGGTYAENLMVGDTNTTIYTWTLSFGGAIGGPTTHFIYPSGIVVPPNTTLEAAETGGCPANFQLTGYLTNN
jgi:hypothetical protein